ncbi:hypothetical protein F5J12DRAFT_101658 [Pisolithus orientalis]|uniref:uncharacterized protein n=1 Tax=Pisolithus orientalis TaxID=936130 RepID=UPI00222526C9|nr:uncharacterized protein F5J12DRAFT_101658 [Pisolithus orientalis]KAI6006618.1 hypothetical protein F5J12DRAFT_101658 [Pisolithus orientalis]
MPTNESLSNVLQGSSKLLRGDRHPISCVLFCGFCLESISLNVAARECFRHTQTSLYLIFYFLMGDVLSATVTVVATLQNRHTGRRPKWCAVGLVDLSVRMLTRTYIMCGVSKSFGYWSVALRIWFATDAHRASYRF